eukprot:4472689-Lingulodinium_polyedra.AAC.1
MEGVFAGTSAAVSEHIVEVYACSFGFPRMVGDVSIAFLHVSEDEIVYITAPVGFRPPEDFIKKYGIKCIWLMKKVLYGRRKAAKRWQEHAACIL